MKETEKLPVGWWMEKIFKNNNIPNIAFMSIFSREAFLPGFRPRFPLSFLSLNRKNFVRVRKPFINDVNDRGIKRVTSAHQRLGNKFNNRLLQKAFLNHSI
jgi:hypothetical protein